MQKSSLLKIALLTLATAAGSTWAAEVVDVYKSPYCGCCEKWADHLKTAGFEVHTHIVNDIPAARQKLGMPERLGSCHTARIGNYAVEGHVPVADIQRLLKEKPTALGLAVPAMPPGSPGMETDRPVHYDTLLVRRDGSTTVYARH